MSVAFGSKATLRPSYANGRYPYKPDIRGSFAFSETETFTRSRQNLLNSFAMGSSEILRRSLFFTDHDP